MQVSPLDHCHASNQVLSFSQLIHPSALISPNASIAAGVSIGPYSIIGDHVHIGGKTSIGAHVSIQGWTHIGESNQIETGAVIGAAPQDLKFAGEKSTVFIGNHNIIREYVTINRGTAGGGGETRIGHHNLIMTSAHVAHDVQMGDHNVVANAVAIGGHVRIDDWVTIGALCGIHQFVQLGRMCMIGAQSKITKDVLPYHLVAGAPPRCFGINVERLRRNRYSVAERLAIQRAYKLFFQKGQSTMEAVATLKKEFPDNPDVQHIVQFVEQSSRSFYR
ncbi:MAG: acyl-ACP--UDP-N-acetylglucosamine O-acyltransferase [Legionellaceae bacterium]|nr:acyl-ACP--UDP-N-acetylglucosamine O-acyltransferase [Legionellaceae bacterium]